MSQANFLGGGSELARLIRGFDWAATPLGPLDAWPQNLRVATGLILQSRIPMVMLWGPDGIMIYNDAYIMFAAGRHPDMLGKRVLEFRPEFAGFNTNVLQIVLGGGRLSYTDQELTVHRTGAAEQAWIDLDYSAVLDDAGVPAGVVAIIIETTGRVRAERERHAAEALLRLERDRSRGVLQKMAEGFALLDRAFQVLDINAEALRLEGRPRGEVIGRVHWSVHPDTGDAPLHDIYKRTLRGRTPLVLEHLATLPDGRQAWLDIRAYPTPDGLALFYREVSDRRRAEDALRDSERTLRELNANLERQVIARSRQRGQIWQVSPDLLSVLQADGTFEATNPAWQVMLGWNEEEMARAVWSDLVHPDDLHRTEKAFTQVMRGEPLLSFENRYRHRDGSIRWLSWVAVREGGRCYCSARDITADKARETALAAYAIERERLWTTSPDLLLVIGVDGVLQRVNPAWTKVLGLAPEDLIGARVDRLIHPQDIEATKASLLVAGSGAMPVVENRYRHKDGSYRWISWVAAPESGVIYATGRHITAQKQQEAELAAAQEALRQSQKTEAIGQLTGGIAHDFNNLLTGISGSLELAETRLAQNRVGEIQRYLSVAQDAARRAASLTQRLLAFSRRQTLAPEPTNANALVAGMDDLIRHTIGPAVTLELTAAPDLWLTRIDPSQLENALLNLAINARDAMPGGGRITVETANVVLDGTSATQRGLDAGQYITISVTDTGVGMPPEVVDRAFDPFFTTKPIGQGTGLGLSMIHGFVRQSGGQVRIVSKVGRGTRMRLYLPRFAGELGAGSVSGRAGTPDQGRGETILVIDDEPTVRLLITEVLEDAGYSTLEAADGPAGLEILRSAARLDLLITDVGLPGGMNGRQVADAARVTRPGLKVLFITGYAESAVLGDGRLEAGMGVITKPFAIELLGRRIREMIES